MKNAPLRYTAPAMALHWVIALGILALLVMGLVMDDLPLMTKFTVIQLHKSLGLTVLMLVALRILWRFTHPAPLLPEGTPRWQKAVAHSTHGLLYGLMVFMPVTGWVFSDAAGYHPNLFGWNVVPLLLQGNQGVAHTVRELHGVGGNLFWVLLALHVGAAVQHHVFKRDDILQRMLPAWLKVPRPNVAKFLPQKLVDILSK